MINIEEKEKCCGCRACFNICPVNAITMEEDEKGFSYPKIDDKKCIKCNLCEKCCPILKKTSDINMLPNAYACRNKNINIRLQSSSGGIFTLLAEKVIEQNGFVFGAGFDKEFNVIHQKIKTKEEIAKLRGSKYVQSNTGNTFKEVKEILENQQTVLYTGTPCQIEGLKKFLGKDYENLLTQDIICHGVPSPKVWKKYLDFREKKDKKKPISINFRDKNTGWKLMNLIIQYKDDKFQQSADKNSYMQAFLKNTSLRDSCYACSFKKINRISDITLSDFWGIENILPEMDDNKGTSLVIIHSQKGKEWFEKIKENIECQKVDLTKAIKYNPSMIESSPKDKKREEFFEKLDKIENFEQLVKKYTYHPTFLKRLIRKIKRMIKGR